MSDQVNYFQQLGLPLASAPQLAIAGRYYCHLAKKLFLRIEERRERGVAVSRYYCRAVGESSYREILTPEDMLLHGEPWVNDSSGTLFSVAQRGELTQREHFIVEVSAAKESVECFATPPWREGVQGLWPAELYGASVDGRTVYAQFAQLSATLVDGTYPVEYILCSFSLDTGELLVIDKYRTPFG